MKRIFIIEDSVIKLEDVKEDITYLYPETEISTYRCRNDFLDELRKEYLEDVLGSPKEYLVILDMELPYYRNGVKFADGGYSILRYLNSFRLGCPAIIVSSERVEDDKALSIYSSYRGSVLHHAFVQQCLTYKRLLT